LARGIEHVRTLSLKGQVLSGKGEAAKFVEFPWVKEQIEAKLGFEPYPGTLNIRLAKDSLGLQTALVAANFSSQEILPKKGGCSGKCVRAYLTSRARGGSECAIITPEVDGYPQDIIEIVAPMNLREKFKFQDGDVIEIKIMI
jgi:CTP-dependent riboflavin kinase